MAYTNIDDPSAHFHTQLYTGTGANQDVVNSAHSGDFKPDLLIIKNRGNGSYGPHYYDSSRGVKRFFYSDQNYGAYAEDYNAQGNASVQLFNTNGFRGGSSTNIFQILWINGLDNLYVAWQWKVNGGTTASNSNGTITSTVQANTTAGFSIVTYTGRDDQLNNGQESKLTHGLGVAPSVFICKRRDGTSNWYYLGGNMSTVNNGWNNVHLLLNQTAAGNGNSYTSNTEPDSTYIYLGNELVNTVDSWVGYAFAEKQGYSKFGKYVGNGNADGAFIYTGFQPAWVMIKRTDATDDWFIVDTTRNTFNLTNLYIVTSNEGGEASASAFDLDIISNGFKLRTTSTNSNASGGAYIYMAFAENPFTTSTGIPTTAR